MAKSFRELICWQLGFQISSNIQKLLKTGPASRDFKFRDQLADAARGPCRNIAEGYGRFNPTEIMQFLGFATATLDETESHLREGVESDYFDSEKVAPTMVLIARCRKAIASWHSYLRQVKDDPRYNQKRRKNHRR